MSESKSRPARAVILTALKLEYLAVLAHLSAVREETWKGTVYERGNFGVGNQLWQVGLVQTGAGNTNAAIEAERAIDYFQPGVVLFVGVAGGIKDVKLGDVVAATRVYGYESVKIGNASGKTGEAEWLARPDVGESSHTLVQRAMAEARHEDWQRRIRGGQVGDAAPEVFVGPIAAGEKVLSSIRSDIYRFLLSHYNDALAVEMEGRGVLRATHSNERVQALIIRGISDLIKGKRKADAQGMQKVAADYASAFAFEILAKLPASDYQQSESGAHQGNKAATTPTRPASGDRDRSEPATKYSINTGTAKQAIGDNATFHEIYNFYGADASPLEQMRREVLWQNKQEGNIDQKDGAIEIFYSYAPEDAKYVKRLEKQLVPLKRQESITDWHEGKIEAGQQLAEEILRHLQTASIILLLVSPDFMASERHNKIEVARAMERQRANEATVIPIILRPTSGWKQALFGHLNPLPYDGKPVVKWPDLDSAFDNIADGIETVVKRLKK